MAINFREDVLEQGHWDRSALNHSSYSRLTKELNDAWTWTVWKLIFMKIDLFNILSGLKLPNYWNWWGIRLIITAVSNWPVLTMPMSHWPRHLWSAERWIMGNQCYEDYLIQWVISLPMIKRMNSKSIRSTDNEIIHVSV